MSSGRFAIATHALALLADAPAGFASDYVARSVNTHPVFLRRVMASLCKAGLVQAREGRGGGYQLARSPKRILLSEVYAATEPEGAIAPSPCEPDTRCPIGGGMRIAFAEAARQANLGLLRSLAKTTIFEIAAQARRHHDAKAHHEAPSEVSSSTSSSSKSSVVPSGSASRAPKGSPKAPSAPARSEKRARARARDPGVSAR